MSFEDLAPELQEKMKNCKTREEFDQLVKETGIELPWMQPITHENYLRAASTWW